MNKFFKRHIFSKRYLFREKKTIIRIYTGKKSQKDVPRDKKKNKKKRVKFIIFSCKISLKLGLNKKTENQEETETKQIKSNSKKKVLQ